MPFTKGHPAYTHKGDFKKGHKTWNKGLHTPGHKHTPEGIEKIRKSKLELYKDKTKHPSYQDGRSLTKEYHTVAARKRQIKKLGNGGSHTYLEWYFLKVGSGFRCMCCLREEPEIHLVQDHIIPLSLGGTDDIENIQPLCRSCNAKKYVNIIRYIYPEPDYYVSVKMV